MVVALSVSLGTDAVDDLRVCTRSWTPEAVEGDLGISVPIPISHPARRYPATNSFPTGPDVGEHHPDIRLFNQLG